MAPPMMMPPAPARSGSSPSDAPDAPYGADDQEGGDESQLSPEDVSALQDGVSPEALDVLKRVLPEECQFLVDVMDQGGDDEGAEGEADNTGAPAPLPVPSGRPMRPATRLAGI